MTASQIALYCVSAFGVGYGVGYVLLLFRRAVEVID
jgi:hypothetical protein